MSVDGLRQRVCFHAACHLAAAAPTAYPPSPQGTVRTLRRTFRPDLAVLRCRRDSGQRSAPSVVSAIVLEGGTV